MLTSYIVEKYKYSVYKTGNFVSEHLFKMVVMNCTLLFTVHNVPVYIATQRSFQDQSKTLKKSFILMCGVSPTEMILSLLYNIPIC